MTFRHWKWGILLGFFAGALVNAAPPAEKPKTRPLELSVSPATESTNLNQLGLKRDGLLQLEEDLSRPLQTFSTKSSLDPVLVPPSQPALRPIPRRIRDRMERKNNWAFNSSPEDFFGGVTAEEIFDMPEYDQNGLEKRKTTSLERMYERLKRQRDLSLTSGGEDDLFGNKKQKRSKDQTSEEEAELLKGVNAGEDNMKKLFAPDEKSSLAPMFKPLMNDLLGSSFQAPSPVEQELHRQHMNDYGNLIGVDSLAVPSNPLDFKSPDRGSSWSDLYAPVPRPAVSLPAGAQPASIAPTPTPVVVPVREPVVSEPPRVQPKVLDFPQRKF